MWGRTVLRDSLIEKYFARKDDNPLGVYQYNLSMWQDGAAWLPDWEVPGSKLPPRVRLLWQPGEHLHKAAQTRKDRLPHVQVDIDSKVYPRQMDYLRKIDYLS